MPVAQSLSLRNNRIQQSYGYICKKDLKKIIMWVEIEPSELITAAQFELFDVLECARNSQLALELKVMSVLRENGAK